MTLFPVIVLQLPSGRFPSDQGWIVKVLDVLSEEGDQRVISLKSIDNILHFQSCLLSGQLQHQLDSYALKSINVSYNSDSTLEHPVFSFYESSHIMF